ncbi:phosphatase PAP2 family protein [Micropruina sp.]|uniref:phosphatase PAP2 family protein n=1 Tax=Micropruina sp. TaxID=2737536 RepID=UPI0039E2C7B4
MTRQLLRALSALVLATVLLVPSGPAEARTVRYPSDEAKPKLTRLLVGFRTLWAPEGGFAGTVRATEQLQWNDRVTSWINQHATRQQQFRALQNAEYLGGDGSGYDQSITIADGLGQRLGALYATGRITGRLPLTAALLNTSTGSAGHYLDTGEAKLAFGYPRPYLPVSGRASPVSGDEAACAPSRVNGSALAALRKGQPWATAAGNLRITRVAPTVDTTRRFATSDVRLDAGYGRSGICLGGSFPSGHTTAAYSAGITLATLLPELAPSILARVSEAANNRVVLGVHYALDVIGGRVAGEAAIAARWSDPKFRAQVLTPARKELVSYLESACGDALAACIAADQPYADDPYGGAAPPLMTSQIVTDRTTALIAYTERLSYGFTPTTPTGFGASAPTGAENLLRTTYPGLNAAQRRAVLAQTSIGSGHPLDTTMLQLLGLADGSWQRLNLAAAMSATVLRHTDGTVQVLSVGGPATVLDD